MRLVRDFGCRHDLLWRIEGLSEDLHADVAAWLAAGFREPEPGSPLLRTLESPEGHRLIVAPSTGRLRLRIDPRLPLAARRPAAEALLAALGRLRRSP